jgi:hypothetical protein
MLSLILLWLLSLSSKFVGCFFKDALDRVTLSNICVLLYTKRRDAQLSYFNHSEAGKLVAFRHSLILLIFFV